MKFDESIIQAEIAEYLTLLGVFFFSVPNEAVGGGPKAVRRMTRYKKMGLYPGMADIVIMDADQKAYFLEIKTEEGRMSRNQKDLQEFCASIGWSYAVARSIQDVVEILEGWGFTTQKCSRMDKK